MKKKIIPLFYSGLLGCTAPKVMVPEVILDRKAVAITSPSEPTILPPKPSLEEMAVYVAAALQEIKKRKRIDEIALSGAVSFMETNYGYDYEYDTSSFCHSDSLQPISKERLAYQFIDIGLQKTTADNDLSYKRINIIVRDFPPFGTVNEVYANVVINDAVKFSDHCSVWKEAQDFYAAMLKDTYMILQTHRNKNGAWSLFELDKIRERKNEEVDFAYKQFMGTLYTQEPDNSPYYVHCPIQD